MMDRQNKYRTLLSNTFLISIGTFGSKLMTFLMVRFYTGILTPSDYGTADLIMQTANLLLPVVSMGIANGVFRFALDQPRSRKSIFSGGVYTITAGSLLFVVIVSFLSMTSTFHGYAGLIACYTLASCYHSLCAQFVRAEGKTALFAGQGILNTALVIGLNILFLVVFRLGIVGYVLSVALADGLCTVYLLLKERLWKLLIRHPRRGIIRKMLRYSIPLIPTTIFWWITSVSDRYMVTGFLGADANGLYAVAYKIPTILTLLSSIFLEAWQFSAISEAEGSRKAHIRFYSQIWSSFQAVMFLAGSVVIALSHLEIRLLTTEEYYTAWQYVPVLAVAMIFAAFASFTGSIYVVEKKSSLSFWTAMAGAVVNLLLNLLLIPTVGIQGAAIATLASYLLSFGIRAISSRKLLPFRLYTGRLICNTLILTAQMIYAVCTFPMWPVVQVVCLLLLLILNRKPIQAVARKIRYLGKEKDVE
uniref:oligosaccharide flippase family protein n=1 Tax=Enterocloster clostridioformis TaxID=1531 RepID=UPI001C3DFBA4|nr:polysaccharide biosynthesis C-terminal domain-containing protein [Enterocloster clostridioformis]